MQIVLREIQILIEGIHGLSIVEGTELANRFMNFGNAMVGISLHYLNAATCAPNTSHRAIIPVSVIQQDLNVIVQTMENFLLANRYGNVLMVFGEVMIQFVTLPRPSMFFSVNSTLLFPPANQSIQSWSPRSVTSAMRTLDGPVTGETCIPWTSNLFSGAYQSAGSTLEKGDKLISRGRGRFMLVMQDDCNLVLYAENYKAIWASNTQLLNPPNCAAVLYITGELIVFIPEVQVLWSSGNINCDRNQPCAKDTALVVHDNGNLVIYDSNGDPDWVAKTDP